MPITFSKAFVCSDQNVFSTLALAQEHELILILKECPPPANNNPTDHEIKSAVANHLLDNAVKIVDILTTKKTSRPAGRAINGNKRPRKPKVENQKEQKPEGLSVGEGEYQNPFPQIMQQQVTPATENKQAVVGYWADYWKDMEFPVQMAKLKIMEATTNAMALKIFDDFGIMPQERRGDPMILASIYGPKVGYSRKTVTFLIGWHLNTRDL
jgi:hypothetical protein